MIAPWICVLNIIGIPLCHNCCSKHIFKQLQMVQWIFIFLKTIMKKINISNNFLNKLVLFERFYFTILDFTLFYVLKTCRTSGWFPLAQFGAYLLPTFYWKSIIHFQLNKGELSWKMEFSNSISEIWCIPFANILLKIHCSFPMKYWLLLCLFLPPFSIFLWW